MTETARNVPFQRLKDSTRSMANLRRDLRFTDIFSVSAVIFVWCLPWLASVCSTSWPRITDEEKGCIAYRCSGYPSCNDSNMGVSVSGFIQTPPATGLMAMTFSWPLLDLWKIDEWMDRRQNKPGSLKWNRLTMYAFQLSFGLFTVCTSNFFPIGHNVGLGTTFVSGAVHYAILLRETRKLGHSVTNFFLGVAIITFLIVVVINISAPFSPVLLKDINPWVFYCLEATGLGAMALVPVAFDYEIVQGRDSVSEASIPNSMFASNSPSMFAKEDRLRELEEEVKKLREQEKERLEKVRERSQPACRCVSM